MSYLSDPKLTDTFSRPSHLHINYTQKNVQLVPAGTKKHITVPAISLTILTITIANITKYNLKNPCDSFSYTFFSV